MGRVLSRFEYFEPTELAEAFELADHESAAYFAGGCDLVVRMRRKEVRIQRIINLSKLPDLDQCAIHPKSGMKIGAMVLINQILNNIWASKRFAALHEAIEQLHPPHIGNMGTLVGNICCGVPYFDLPTSLVALNTELQITGPQGTRQITLEDFYQGIRQTNLQHREIVTSLFVPPPNADAGSAFMKIYRTRRQVNDLHKINAASSVSLDSEHKKIIKATICVGSWEYKPLRFRQAEKKMSGAVPTVELFTEIAEMVVADLKPITDMPWVEQTRVAQAKVMVRDVLLQAASRARSRHDPFEDAQEILEGR